MSLKLNTGDFVYLGTCLAGLFFGLYSGIFAMFLQYHISQKGTDKETNIVFYTLSVLYVLSAASMAFDITGFFLVNASYRYLYVIHNIVFACCDFMAQSILIYRCWIVWRRNIRVVIIPSILAFAFLATWITSIIPQRVIVGENQIQVVSTSETLTSSTIVTSIVLSMTVNALATGLIVLRIFQVFQGAKTTKDDEILGVTGGSTLRRIIFVLIESGMALFSVQLVRLVVTLVTTDAADDTYQLVVFMHEMLNGITPTIILVRVSMGLSFHDEDSMETSIGSLHFASANPNQASEMGSIGIVEQEKDIDIQLSDDSDILSFPQ